MEEEIIYNVEVKGIQSIENLTKANKELREERKKLNLQSEEGQKRAAEINKQLDANTEIIRKNSSALEKQRLNVGNYTGALDKLVPGLGATANGFMSMKSTAMAFIATPIGAVIGALGLAIGALTVYFKGSEEGQDSLSKAMNIGKVIFEQVTLVVEKLGEVLFKSISFVADLAMKVVDFVAPAVSQALQVAIDAANQITELEDSIDARENELIVRRAENAKKVAQLREQALSLEGDAKRKVIQEAIDLEKALAKEETEQAANRLKLLEAQIAAEGRATEEQKKQRADLTAAKINAEKEEYSSTLRFQKEIEKLNDETRKKQEEQAAIDGANRRANSESANIEELTIKQLHEESKIQLTTTFEQANLNVKKSFANKNVEITKKQNELILENEKVKESQMAALQNQAFATAATLFGRFKTAQIGLSLISTYFSAQKAFESQFQPFALVDSPVRGAIAAGLAIVQGLARTNQIRQAPGFALGGKVMSGDGTPIQRSNGDNILATVKTGEVILNENHQRMLGGDATFRRLGVPGFASGGIVASAAQRSESIAYQYQLFEAISRIQPVVTVEDINAGVNRVQVIEDRARVIR